MSKLSIDSSARARNIHSLVLQRLGIVVNSTIAEELGQDGPWLSKFKNDRKNNGLTELETVCMLLDKLGLKVIPEQYQCYDKQLIDSIFFLARLSMNRASEINDFQHTAIAPRLEEYGY
ncbi:hypothetical protein [Acinetobacter ursingii]|uniref:hypothetical protein n=1 Tax=Acinetobacter ursingii TaxID=108980 RepID=UPI0021CD68FB|nr:hypothetical protein [Acinetobacter ursingii]MCU4483535.1 hypothetical protein [Acinetobacter ursingii]MCU4507855.1 hypothetical protein [Acinetobacter ursingii]